MKFLPTKRQLAVIFDYPSIYTTRRLRYFHKQCGSIRYHDLSAQWPVFLSDIALCCTVTPLDKNSPSPPFSVSQPNTHGSFRCVICSHLQTVLGPIWSSVLVDTETTALYIASFLFSYTIHECMYLRYKVAPPLTAMSSNSSAFKQYYRGNLTRQCRMWPKSVCFPISIFGTCQGAPFSDPHTGADPHYPSPMDSQLQRRTSAVALG